MTTCGAGPVLHTFTVPRFVTASLPGRWANDGTPLVLHRVHVDSGDRFAARTGVAKRALVTGRCRPAAAGRDPRQPAPQLCLENNVVDRVLLDT